MKSVFRLESGVMPYVTMPSKSTRDSSEYAILWLTRMQQIRYLPAVTVQWGAQQADLTLIPEDSSDEAALASVGPSPEPVIIGYRHWLGICRVTENRFVSEMGRKSFHLRVAIERSDFTPSIEMGLGGTSADKLAELRTRRLLLNENPAVESRDINVVTRELFLGGQDTVVRVQKSPFPDLFKAFHSTPERFLEIAWIQAAASLKLSACVVEIVALELTLKGNTLDVKFHGRRRKQFQNRPPYEIQVNGSCALS